MPALTSYTIAKITQIRELCSFLEDNAAELRGDFHFNYANQLSSYYWTHNQESDNWREGDTVTDAKADIAADLRTMRGDARYVSNEKSYETDTFQVTVTLFSGAKVIMSALREAVCVKTVTGTEEVQERDYANAPMVTVTKDVVTWECSPLLGE